VGIKARIAAGTLVLASGGLLSFLATWEGDGQNTVYPDQFANGLPTVCMGLTRHTSPVPVIVGDYWSDEKCAEIEQIVIQGGQLELADCIRNDRISQNTFDALSSFAHNVGTPSACASRAMGLINAGRVADGCKALAWGADGRKVWAYAGGRYVRGLHNRRLAEVQLCLKP